jgi:DNA-binding NarL/FixJ family response regulator
MLASGKHEYHPRIAMQQAGTDTATVLRDHVRVALEDAGLMVVGEAADGAHALTQAAARDPDVVLMDLRVPGMDGSRPPRRCGEQQPHVVLWTGEATHSSPAPSASPARPPALIPRRARSQLT